MYWGLSVLDLRDPQVLQPFVDVISEIDVPDWIVALAKKRKQSQPRTVSSVEQLRSLIFDPNFTQWGSLIDQPSASQWLGYYAKEAGIHGIVYPSVRNSEGYNMAVFPESFLETSARIELADPASGVREEDTYLDEANSKFQMQISVSKSGEVFH